MDITFKQSDRYKDRWDIFVAEEKWGEGHHSIFGKRPKCQTSFDEYEWQRVKSYVVWRLSSQSYHSEQLAQLLRKRLVQEKTIGRVLDEFIASGILNDQAWMENYISQQLRRSSLRLILSKLRFKGFSKETLEQAAMDWSNPEEEDEALSRLLQTKYRKKNLKDYKEKQKVMASLLRKGYSFEQVNQALNRTQDK